MTEDAKSERSKAEKIVSALILILWPFVGVSIVFSLLGVSGIKSYIPDICCHFFAQYLMLQSCFIVGLLVARRWRQALAVLPFAILCASQIVPFYFSDSPAAVASSASLKVLQINVNAANERDDLVEDCVRRYSPDIVVFEEVNERWQRQLESRLQKDYPHIVKHIREDCFGISLFSQRDLQTGEIELLGFAQVPIVHAVVLVDNSRVDLLGAHVIPPLPPDNFDERNREIEQLRSLRQKLGGNLIVVGDFNCSPWSPYFKEILGDMTLANSRNGFGVQPSWPVQIPLARIPIDQCLASKDRFRVNKFEIGPHVGSDHYPVYAQLSLTKSGKEISMNPPSK